MRTETFGKAKLILGDSREIAPCLTGIDAVLTDPPFGTGFPYESYDDTKENLIDLIDNVIKPLIAQVTRVIITPGKPNAWDYPKPDWLAVVTWNTTNTFGKCGFDQFMPVLIYGKDVALNKTEKGITKSDVIFFNGGVPLEDTDKQDHPCPKPERIMTALVTRFTNCHETVLDPFLGSGTTGVSCLLGGRAFVGIEKEEKYFDCACRRIEHAEKQANMMPKGFFNNSKRPKAPSLFAV